MGFFVENAILVVVLLVECAPFTIYMQPRHAGMRERARWGGVGGFYFRWFRMT